MITKTTQKIAKDINFKTQAKILKQTEKLYNQGKVGESFLQKLENNFEKHGSKYNSNRKINRGIDMATLTGFVGAVISKAVGDMSSFNFFTHTLTAGLGLKFFNFAKGFERAQKFVKKISGDDISTVEKQIGAEKIFKANGNNWMGKIFSRLID